MLEHLAQSYSFQTTSSTTSTGVGVFLLVLGLIVLVLAIISVVGLWKMFKKAGRPGWAAIIPFYSNWVMAEIAGKPGWWGLLWLVGIIPVIGIFLDIIPFVLFIIICIELAKRFGKTPGFAALMVILPFVGFSILGFGPARYSGSSKPDVPPAGGPAPTPPTPPMPPVAPTPPVAPIPPAAPAPPIPPAATQPPVNPVQ